jgi:tetratricopeptide (TPR) repeat protein
MVHWRGGLRSIAEACALAAQEQGLGNLRAALDIYDLVLGKLPSCAEAHNNRAAILQLMMRSEEALAGYDRAIAIKPKYTTAHFNRGLTLKQMNRREEALAGYDKALTLDPDNAEIHNSRGVLLQQMRRYDEALGSYQKAVAANPIFAAAHNNWGTALVSKGNMVEAENLFRKACNLKPGFPDPLFNLTRLRRYHSPSGPEFDAIRACLEKPGLRPEDKDHLLFALGKIYDDSGLYDEAFESFQQANRIRNCFVSHKPAAVTRMTGDLIEVFSHKFLSRRFEFASENQRPLFIVGMPRSGTTLLANIMSNHSAIGTAGEMSVISDFARDLKELTKRKFPYPHAARHIISSVALRLINQYEGRLECGSRPDLSHIVDKNPLNFQHLGLISMLFPKAQIIHCTRHPLDTCLSNYFQRFPLSLDYSFDLENICHFYREYVRLMDHWRRVMNPMLFEVTYEDLVLNTEETVRKMLGFLGLEWDVRCLSPQTNPCPVETASEWQVRQPIYRDSVGRWRHYEKYLAPLKQLIPSVARVAV